MRIRRAAWRRRVNLETGFVTYTSRIRGLVVLPPKAPRYYTANSGDEKYVMLRLIWRIGWMSFSYAMEVPDDAASTAAGIHDLERHANTGGAN